MLTLAVSEVVASTGKEAGAPGKISHTEAIRPTPDPVSAARMQQVYEAVKTPFKYGLVLAPERNDYKMDCPVVFRHGRDWYMTYLVYNGKEGKDGRGYETWLAESSDLLTWRSLGKILSFKDTGWDTNQRGGFMSLIDRRWGGGYHVRKVGGQYWMTYIGGNTPGYEQGMLKVGVAHTAGHIGEAHEWETFDRPVLSPEDPANGWWESLTQYKSSVMWDKQLILGAPFVMFYNAGGVNPVSNVKGERIGIALSHDMKNWTRYAGNPVVNHEGGITGDADVQQMGDLFVLFYYSAFRPGVPYKAYNNFCCSYDLIHWTDWKGEKLIYPSESYDDLFAHKPCVISHNGIVYHFYCAVNQANQRGIALATSKPVGRSAVRFPEPESTQFRKELSLNGAWSSRLDGDSTWTAVFVPHNWDQYYGYRRLKHGNLHGTAWYKRTFQTPADLEGNRCFLYFEGVGSYATVFVNGRQIGAHQGGLTTFTLDVTGALHENGWNELMVKVEQPAMISDLPWICGGCSGEMGFSEGSQPLGIFRPVTLVVTNEVRIQPFGVFLWNEPGSIRPDGAETQVETTLKNYGKIIRSIQVVSKLVDENGIMAARSVNDLEIDPGEEDTIQQVLTMEKAPERWSPEKPVLYTLITLLKEDGKVIDELRTPYGFRTVSWPQTRNDGDHRLYINDKPVFLNGIGEYEHQLGISHSFSDKQIESRVQQIKAAGFNAFRDAHQPHNLLYKDLF
ncbi:MAG: glycoside hydrolase family 2 TIM barrel-domain containing protein, partial [Bacteroidota bacterium]|nr:glycoside hydrolase family 2 TIM barrel-domain containing protein [Bacteroidota bacterium]